MDDWSPQKMLDLYIHDYFIMNNMHESAEIFAQEADIDQKIVAITPPDGFMKEWWSIFYETYLHQTQNNVTGNECLLSQANLVSGNVPHYVNLPQQLHLNMPAVAPVGFLDLLQIVRPTMVARHDIGHIVGHPFSVPKTELNQNMFRPLTISDFSIRPEQSITSYLTVKRAEQDCLRLPGRVININSQSLERNGPVFPSSNNGSHPQKNVCPNPQLSLTGGDMGGSSSRRPMIVAPATLVPNAPQIREEPAAIGSLTNSNSNSISSESYEPSGSEEVSNTGSDTSG